MDCIDRAIIKGRNVSQFDSLNMQTWEMFERDRNGKKLFLFGTGAVTELFFAKYHDKMPVEGVLDNDGKKQGINVRDLLGGAWENSKRDSLIGDKSVLKAYNPEQIIVLICSLNYGDEIARELRGMGIEHIYSFLIMEAKERDRRGIAREGLAEDEKASYAGRYLEAEIQERKILFRAFGDYADHEKYITEALLKAGQNLDLVWLVSDLHTEVPAGVRKVLHSNWQKAIYEYETARIWVSDLPVPEYIKKKPGQIYIQTKHWASITLKKFYLDTKAFREEPEKLKIWKREGEMIDYIVTGSEFDKESCKRGFGNKCRFIEAGSPRTDAMFHEADNRRKILDYYGIEGKKKLLLYAPTYRFDEEKGSSMHTSRNIEMDFGQIKKALEEKFGGSFMILLRLHPSVSNACSYIEFPPYVVNVSDYGDSQELASAADIMISDYSSIMFEPAFVGKPVFLFATDKREYQEREYDLLIDYDTLPFPIAESNLELAGKIHQFDRKAYEKRVEEFLRLYGVNEDGHASERAAAAIVQLTQGEKSCLRLQ